MSKKLSFEEALRQKMNELPLPDENESWQQMKALLDEKEKRRTFFFFRNEKIVGGALLFCALMFWAVVSLYTEKTSTTMVVRKDDKAGSTNSQQENKRAITETTSKNSKTKEAQQEAALSTLPTSSAATVSSVKKNGFSPADKDISTAKKQNNLGDNNTSATHLSTWQNGGKETQQGEHSSLQKQDDNITRLYTKNQADPSFFTNDSMQLSEVIDSSQLLTSIGVDSNQNADAGKGILPKKDSASANNAAAKTTIKIKRRNAYFVDAGVGIKQQLPIGNQAFTAYNYNGNKGWLGDYIPSLYVRLEKEKRWFVQGEFHYAAPRLVSKTAYWQKTRADYNHSSTTMDKYYLQKTWYNEVPLSFNLYLRPSLSVGAGVMYNMLRGATGKRETSVYDVLAQHSVYDEAILSWKGYTDSFLYKTNTSLLVQADYDVERWSFGVRYLQDVQPYLTYTLPDGMKKDKRNTSLEVLVRYRLFRSEKFRLGKW